MKKPDSMVLTKVQKSDGAAKIREYIMENFDIEIGNLQAEIFLDFVTNNMGAYYYNKGISDSMSFMSEKCEDLYLLMKDEN